MKTFTVFSYTACERKGMDGGMKIFTNCTPYYLVLPPSIVRRKGETNELMIIISASWEEERRYMKFYRGNILILKTSISITGTSIEE
jgi:hypothetical protein